MSRLSGWCSGPIGCNSKADHQTCQERQDRGQCGRCDCEDHGGHTHDDEEGAA